MLKERVLSAIVLIALVLCALFLFTPFYFALALSLIHIFLIPIQLAIPSKKFRPDLKALYSLRAVSSDEILKSGIL